MAIIDKDLVLSDAQAFTSVATHDSTNVIDLDAANSEICNDLEAIVRVNTTVTSASGGTVAVALVTSDKATLSGATTLASTAATAKATLVAGYTALRVRLPKKGTGSGLNRYLGVQYTVATYALSAGKFDAYLVPAADLNNV